MTTGSDNRVLLDTSVWIDYFRKKETVYSRVEQLIDENRICTTRFIMAELLCGALSDTEFATLKTGVEIFDVLEEREDTWIEAARLASGLRRLGRSVGIGDCYIATLAHQHQVSLWSFDKHFRTIQQQLKLSLYAP